MSTVAPDRCCPATATLRLIEHLFREPFLPYGVGDVPPRHAQSERALRRRPPSEAFALDRSTRAHSAVAGVLQPSKSVEPCADRASASARMATELIVVTEATRGCNICNMGYG